MEECKEMKFKTQALIDNELSEEEIPAVISHIESCYSCRGDYISLLKLQRRMKGLSFPDPDKEWFENLSKKKSRKALSILGKFLFIGSYILLLSYSAYTFFIDNSSGVFARIAVGGIVLGVLILLAVTVGDRVKESRTDKYKGVIK